MTDNRKVLHYQSDFDKKVKEVCKDVNVRVRLGDLEQLLKATEKCLNFVMMSDFYLGNNLTVDDTKIAEAYKYINESLKEDKKKILSRAERKISKKFKVIA